MEPWGQFRQHQDQPVTLEAQDLKGARELQELSDNKETLVLLGLWGNGEFKVPPV